MSNASIIAGKVIAGTAAIGLAAGAAIILPAHVQAHPKTIAVSTIDNPPAFTDNAVQDKPANVIDTAPSNAPVVEGNPIQQTPQPEPVVLETPNEEALRNVLGDVATPLIEKAKTDPDAAWIAAHPEAYEQYGYLQEKLLRLAATDPASIPYVRHFPEKGFSGSPDYNLAGLSKASPSTDVPDTNIPHLYQWDQRWGFVEFNGETIGTAACGPTSLTMVYQGLTGKDDITPYEMSRRAIDTGHVVPGEGTAHSLFTDFAGELGLSCWESYVDEDTIRSELEAGHPIIANVGPGIFSDSGHFLVLAGIAPDGRIIVNDPYSMEKSARLWDIGTVASETYTMFVFSRA